MLKTCRYLTKRSNGVFYYARRYPIKITQFFDAKLYRKSLKTNDISIAVSRYEAVHLATELEWERLKIEGVDENANILYMLALEKAQSLNMNYLTNSDLLQKNLLEEVMKRISYLHDQNIPIDELTAKTVIGSIDAPVVTIENALDLYFDEIAKQEQSGISKNQLRVWKSPRKRAVVNFVKMNGNLVMDDIERRHVMKLRKMWLERINNVLGDDAKPSTAKKDFGYLSVLYKEYYQHIGEFDRMNPFSNVTFKHMDNDKGVPFPTALIKKMFLSDNFYKLNFEARMIFFAFADSGARPSELCGLDESDIILDHKYPHIIITDKPHRRLKNKSSNRTIPLVGTALAAFKNYPKGFIKYKLNETRLCAVINKFLRANKYKISKKHSFYSLRHSFIDRMEEAGLEEEFRHRILGHTLKTQQYGDGGSLEFRANQLKKVEVKFDKALFKAI